MFFDSLPDRTGTKQANVAAQRMAFSDVGMSHTTWIKQSVENHISEHAFTLDTRLSQLEERCNDQQAKLSDLHALVLELNEMPVSRECL